MRTKLNHVSLYKYIEISILVGTGIIIPIYTIKIPEHTVILTDSLEHGLLTIKYTYFAHEVNIGLCTYCITFSGQTVNFFLQRLNRFISVMRMQCYKLSRPNCRSYSDSGLLIAGILSDIFVPTFRRRMGTNQLHYTV